MVCEKGARATGSPPCTYCHTYILLYIRTAIHTSVLLLTTQQLYSDFRGFNNGVCNVIRITITESNPAMELLAQQTFCFRPNILPGKQTKKKRKKRQLNDVNFRLGLFINLILKFIDICKHLFPFLCLRFLFCFFHFGNSSSF